MASQRLVGEADTVVFGAWLAGELRERYQGRAVVYLHGELGAGKTTLVRGVLRAMGHEGTVKSPTYTLLEPYEPEGGLVYHFDLYRVEDPTELEFIGADEILDGPGLKLIEWPQRAMTWLPRPDVEVTLATVASTKVDNSTRKVHVEFY